MQNSPSNHLSHPWQQTAPQKFMDSLLHDASMAQRQGSEPWFFNIFMWGTHKLNIKSQPGLQTTTKTHHFLAPLWYKIIIKHGSSCSPSVHAQPPSWVNCAPWVCFVFFKRAQREVWSPLTPTTVVLIQMGGLACLASPTKSSQLLSCCKSLWQSSVTQDCLAHRIDSVLVFLHC